MIRRKKPTLNPLLLAAIYLFCCLTIADEASAQKKKGASAPVASASQPVKIVSYEVLENGDTINRLDQFNHKHGKWLLFHEARYNEPPFYEYGSYDQDVRVGVWNVYDKDGHTLSEEYFKQGVRDGEARYFENGKLYCIGHYLALRSKYEYDTVMVEDPVTNNFRPVVVKSQVGSVRHGLWTFFNPTTAAVDRVVEYQVDEVIYDRDYSNRDETDSLAIELKTRSLPHVSKKQPSSVWSLDKNKRPVKYTDFPDNTQYVKPNVRRDGKK